MAAGGAGSTQPQCPDYVPYSVAFPGQDGGPPPAGAPQPGAWYVDLAPREPPRAWPPACSGSPPARRPAPRRPIRRRSAPRRPASSSFPSPSLALSPATTGYVNLAEWLWIDPSIWHPFTTTAQACNAGGCTTATATATPAYVTWNTGDGSTVTCNGPGTAYNPALRPPPSRRPARTPTPTTSAGQPTPNGNPNDAAFPITATVTWTVRLVGPQRFGRLACPASPPEATDLAEGRPDRIREQLRNWSSDGHHHRPHRPAPTRPAFAAPPETERRRPAPVHRHPPAPPLADRPRRRSGARLRRGGRSGVPVVGQTGVESSWRRRTSPPAPCSPPAISPPRPSPPRATSRRCRPPARRALVGQQLDTPVYAGQVMVKPDAVDHTPARRRVNRWSAC